MRYHALALLSLVTSPLKAQSATHLRAAHELIALQSLEAGNRQADSGYVEWLLEQNPDLKAYRDIVEQHSRLVYDWAAIEPVLARSLTTLFSEAELLELAGFWRSPLGRKWAASGPARAQARAAFMDRRFVEYNDDFNARLRAAARERGLRRPVVRFIVPG